MRLLAIDTATSAVTVAVHDGERALAERTVVDARRHTELLAPFVREVLREAGLEPADLTDVAVGTGPAPFTGLRVGIVTARTTAVALGIPVHGVCSLDALAHAVALDGVEEAGTSDPPGASVDELLVATDARRKEVYWARYALDGGTGEAGEVAGGRAVRRIDGPHVARAADLPEPVRALPTLGRGPGLYPEELPHGRAPLDVSAAVLADLAARRIADHEPMPTEPLYLRRPDATVAAAVPRSTLAAGVARRQGEP